MARSHRQASPQILHQPARSPPVRSRTKGASPPKTEGAGPTIAQILRAAFPGEEQSATAYAIRALIAQAGTLPAQKLSAAHVAEIDQLIRNSKLASSTRHLYAKVLRSTLRWLWEHYGAPKLDNSIRKYAAPRPRNVTATDEDRDRMLTLAPPHLRLWLLFCSDLAIRSGTASRLAPEHYDRVRRKLTFTTKYGEKLTLPTTAAIELMLDDCDMRNPEPFVRQLWVGYRSRPGAPQRRDQLLLLHQFARLRKTAGIDRRITPHDLRRTTAVAMYQHTRNVRKVQALLGHRNMNSTIWYLDHDLEPVDIEVLETIKKPYIVHRKEQSA